MMFKRLGVTFRVLILLGAVLICASEGGFDGDESDDDFDVLIVAPEYNQTVTGPIEIEFIVNEEVASSLVSLYVNDTFIDPPAMYPDEPLIWTPAPDLEPGEVRLHLRMGANGGVISPAVYVQYDPQ